MGATSGSRSGAAHRSPGLANAPAPRRSPPLNRVFRAIRRSWHAACIPFMVSGCLYLHGPWYLIENTPPEQVTVSPDGFIVRDGENLTAVIEFFDVDGDPIAFTWSVDGRIENRVNRVFGTQRVDADGRLIQGSVLSLVREEIAVGQEVQCVIRDTDPDLPPQVRRWIIIEQRGDN